MEKLLRDVDRFSCKKNEDAEEFLETLEDKVLEGRLGRNIDRIARRSETLVAYQTRPYLDMGRIQDAIPPRVRTRVR